MHSGRAQTGVQQRPKSTFVYCGKTSPVGTEKKGEPENRPVEQTEWQNQEQRGKKKGILAEQDHHGVFHKTKLFCWKKKGACLKARATLPVMQGMSTHLASEQKLKNLLQGGLGGCRK